MSSQASVRGPKRTRDLDPMGMRLRYCRGITPLARGTAVIEVDGEIDIPITSGRQDTFGVAACFGCRRVRSRVRSQKSHLDLRGQPMRMPSGELSIASTVAVGIRIHL